MPMISFVDNVISQELATAIVNIIEFQCALIEERENRNERDYPELYDEDYMKMRRHSYTGSVYAGFRRDTIIPGATISKRRYGRGHYQPEFESASAVIQIYSSEASLDIQEIHDKCEQYNTQNSDKEYIVFRFWTGTKGHLTRVELLHFDEEANIISKSLIYKYKAQVIPIAG